LAMRIISISVAPPKVAKARTMVTIGCRWRRHCDRHYRAKLRHCKYGLSNDGEKSFITFSKEPWRHQRRRKFLTRTKIRGKIEPTENSLELFYFGLKCLCKVLPKNRDFLIPVKLTHSGHIIF
jgi:hypothetical protein